MIRAPLFHAAGGVCFTAITVVTLLLTTAGPANAQTLNSLEAVCKDGLFYVAWTGPNTPGDRIAIVDPNDPTGQPLSSGNTSAGNPVWLRAPDREGEFELRYLPAGSLEPTVDRDILVGDCSESVPEQLQNRALLVTGTQYDFGTKVNRNMRSPLGGPAGFTIDDLCANADTIAWAFQSLIGNLELEVARAGLPIGDFADTVAVAAAEAGRPLTFAELDELQNAPSREQIEANFATAREELCNAPPPSTTVQPFVIAYAYCRMTMITQSHMLDIQLPPGGGAGTMSMADHSSGEVLTMALQRSSETLENIAGQGWSSGVSMSPAGGASTHAGYPTQLYSFEYTAGMSTGSGGALAPIAAMITATNEGTAWMANDVPGMDIVQAFYSNLTTEVSLGQGGASFFGGLVNSLVGMLSYGLPLDIEQEVKSKVLGVTTVSGRSRNTIHDLRVVDAGPEWCYGSIMPTNYTVTDVDEQLSQAMGAAGNQDPQTQQAMQQYQDAMDQMTPEQLAMMESMGMGDMMQQAMGAAGGSNAQPSAALTTDNLTQSVQMHLDALGFDTGNTTGEEALATSIAISQYQAERGLAVTGEVSAELLRTLSAEINGGQ